VARTHKEGHSTLMNMKNSEPYNAKVTLVLPDGTETTLLSVVRYKHQGNEEGLKAFEERVQKGVAKARKRLKVKAMYYKADPEIKVHWS